MEIDRYKARCSHCVMPLVDCYCDWSEYEE